ncbi:hypothetical protein F9C11_20320 [Amycolatopsis sp. VS8301801F10]|uniref:hypothetical protein n=1 Tax=unclassified Amycolatopsis TaxID=2618356 RepID=UPI0038FC5917
MSKAAVEYKADGVVVLAPHPAFPEPHNRFDHGVCGCGKKVGDIAGWEEHRKEIGRGKLRSRLRSSTEPSREERLARELRDRNRAYGKASATIGELRGHVARLTAERFQEWAARPGAVDGDVLFEVLRAAAPERWTAEARGEFADQVMRDMVASGFRVLRGPGREPWPAVDEPGFRRFHADQVVQSTPARTLPFEPRVGMRVVRKSDGASRKVTSVRPDESTTYGLAVFVDEGRVTEFGPLNLDEWKRASWVPKPGGEG